jgi:hypothetical protein
MTDSQSTSLSWCDQDQIFIIASSGIPSLMRGWVPCLQLLLTFPSIVILGSESHRTYDHISCLRFETPPTSIFLENLKIMLNYLLLFTGKPEYSENMNLIVFLI